MTILSRGVDRRARRWCNMVRLVVMPWDESEEEEEGAGGGL